jgi:hypothetical protein
MNQQDKDFMTAQQAFLKQMVAYLKASSLNLPEQEAQQTA